MLTITNMNHPEEIYRYQLGFHTPYFFHQDYARWEKSFVDDVDDEGRQLFRQLTAKEARDEGKLVGFIQYGRSAFGFEDQGDISGEIAYPIIRNLYFDSDRPDAGELLLREALTQLGSSDTVYAFFHYFGMSCFARHGKLFEKHGHVEALLRSHGFEIEHENVYYSSILATGAAAEIEIKPQSMTKGNQQYLDFLLAGEQAGGCEVHFVDEKTAYLRWIYINGNLTGQGIGTKCMKTLKQWLSGRGITRFDTDTALTNPVAQHYYEKNGFTREGITRSFYRKGHDNGGI